MKKVFTVALLSLVTLLSFAADNPRDGRLRVSNFSRQDVVVVIDGRVIRDRDDNFMIGLRPGYHEVKVFRHDNWGRRRHSTIFNNGGRLIFDNSVFVIPGGETRVIIDRGGQVFVARERGRDGRYGRDRDYDYGYGDRDRRDHDWK